MREIFAASAALVSCLEAASPRATIDGLAPPEPPVGFTSSLENGEPPYYGSLFHVPLAVDANIAPNYFKSVVYQGYDERTWWDYRDCCYGWQTGTTHIFYVKTTDNTEFEVIMNPQDFPDANIEGSEGYQEMWRHVQALCRIPYVFRQWMNRLSINGDGPGSRGGASRWMGSVTVNTGYSKALFEDAPHWPGTIEEFFVHEGTHGAVDLMFRDHPEWLAAQQNDWSFISQYAQDFPEREDLAETVPAWMWARQNVDVSREYIDLIGVSDEETNKIARAIPNRLRFLEKYFTPYLDGSIYNQTTQAPATTENPVTTASSSTQNPITSSAECDVEPTCEYHGQYFGPCGCDSFWQCSLVEFPTGIPYKHPCPTGLLFDTYTNTCQWPDQLCCLDSENCDSRNPPAEDFECSHTDANSISSKTKSVHKVLANPEETVGIPDECRVVPTCEHHGQYFGTCGCPNFFHCSHDIPFQSWCPTGLHFDTASNTCQFPEQLCCLNEDNCSNAYPPAWQFDCPEQ